MQTVTNDSVFKMNHITALNGMGKKRADLSNFGKNDV